MFTYMLKWSEMPRLFKKISEHAVHSAIYRRWSDAEQTHTLTETRFVSYYMCIASWRLTMSPWGSTVLKLSSIDDVCDMFQRASRTYDSGRVNVMAAVSPAVSGKSLPDIEFTLPCISTNEGVGLRRVRSNRLMSPGSVLPDITTCSLHHETRTRCRNS